MAHNHNHNHSEELNGTSGKILFTIILNIGITIAEVIGGLISNSLALISDALHNAGDVVAIIFTYIGNLVSKRKSNHKKTFGYKRVEILIALFNSISVIAISLFLMYEAFERIAKPAKINGLVMMIVAIAGLLGNGISALILKPASGENLNVRSAYIHLFADTLSSVAVIAGSIFIYYYNIYWLDPVLTFIIALYVIKEGYSIIKETLDILMQSTPSDIDIDEIQRHIEKLNLVKNIHHVHVWRLNDTDVHFEAHIELCENISIKAAEEIIIEINEMLEHEFGITHVTLQPEFNFCKEQKLIRHS